MIRTIILGQGMVANYFAVGLERIKAGEIPPYGVPLANVKLRRKIEEIEIVGSYDVDARKVGKTIYEVAKKEIGEVSPIPEKLKEVEVREGVHLRSLNGVLSGVLGLERKMTLKDAVNIIVDQWKEMNPDVIVNIITTENGKPTNSINELEEKINRNDVEKLTATQVYAYATLKYKEETGRKVAFVNAIPTPIANDENIVEIYEKNGLPLFGDDGATGATPLTADLLEHMATRNRKIEFIVQFNIAGNTDFLALTLPEKNLMKEVTKSSMIKDILGYDVPHYIKPTGYLEPMGDKKFVAMHMEYYTFNNLKDEIYINVRMNDSPALAGLLVDLVRIGRICIDKGICGAVYPVNLFYMKMPGPPGSKSTSKILAFQKLKEWLREIDGLVEE
ncbi:MAG: myo-inositol-1-phosphate synthase [archaeon YNP-WB-062]|jgi:myo-inositol-1-phosphate synthase|nr:myo-inositol-1-phosphate synthase [Candidatus Culexarchaeum yellowstonense]